jgi:cytochrome c oxidase cbb3-type subunit III
MSSFWSAWIIILTLITFILTLWILLSNRKSGSIGGTTGHTHDGIEEYDNPLPQWWLVLFLGSMVFGAGYLIAFPGLGNFPGLLNWTQINHYEAEVAKAEQQYAPLYAQYAATPIEQLHQIPEAMKMAQRIFGNNCAQCHGSDAGGAFGFPNLTDDDWLWGGEIANIRTTILQGRNGLMPGWGGVLQTDQAEAVVAYTQKISGQQYNAVLAEAGESVFSTFCVACHGPTGTGNILLGAPNLTDDIWLYGSDATWIRQAVIVGRSNQMPAHNVLLSEDKIHLLTAYVYGLSRE